MFIFINSKKIFIKDKDGGFSLLELVAVLIITSVLAITVIPRFSIANNDLSVAKNSVLTALRHSREIALARSQTNNLILFIGSTSTIDVRENGVSVEFPDIDYPILLPSGITVRGPTLLLTFDRLGASTASIIEITNGNSSERITLTSGGYAY